MGVINCLNTSIHEGFGYIAGATLYAASETISNVGASRRRSPSRRLTSNVLKRLKRGWTTNTGYGWPGFTKMNLWRQDKDQKACAAAFVRAIEAGSEAPIPLEELLEVGRVTVELAAG
jgi:hypothetical protein